MARYIRPDNDLLRECLHRLDLEDAERAKVISLRGLDALAQQEADKNARLAELIAAESLPGASAMLEELHQGGGPWQ